MRSAGEGAWGFFVAPSAQSSASCAIHRIRNAHPTIIWRRHLPNPQSVVPACAHPAAPRPLLRPQAARLRRPTNIERRSCIYCCAEGRSPRGWRPGTGCRTERLRPARSDLSLSGSQLATPASNRIPRESDQDPEETARIIIAPELSLRDYLRTRINMRSRSYHDYHGIVQRCLSMPIQRSLLRKVNAVYVSLLIRQVSVWRCYLVAALR